MGEGGCSRGRRRLQPKVGEVAARRLLAATICAQAATRAPGLQHHACAMHPGTPYLQLYAQHVLALQRLQRQADPTSPPLPVVIMTSEDTDQATRDLISRLGAAV